MIDGVDLTEANVGDELTLSTHDADVLIAEGWAEPAANTHGRPASSQEWASNDRPARKRRPAR